MKFFAAVVLVAVLLGAAWSKYITGGGLLRYYDKNPKEQTGPSVMYVMGKGYEVVSNWDMTLQVYTRIVERYPNSSYALDAQFGVALSYEKLNRYGEAIEQYQKFLDKYPNSRYAPSVRNNIEILKSR